MSLSIIAALKNNSSTTKTTSTPVLLNPSPYINCNYFERDPTTTTTSGPNTTTTTAPPNSTTTTTLPNSTTTTTLPNSTTTTNLPNSTTTTTPPNSTTTTTSPTSTTTTTSPTSTTTTTLLPKLTKNSSEVPYVDIETGDLRQIYTNTNAYPPGTKISVLLIGQGGGGSDYTDSSPNDPVNTNHCGGCGGGISFTYVFSNELAVGDLTIRYDCVVPNGYGNFSASAWADGDSVHPILDNAQPGASCSITFKDSSTTYNVAAGGGSAAGNGTFGGGGGGTAGETGVNVITVGTGDTGEAGFDLKNGYTKENGSSTGLGSDTGLSNKGIGGQPGQSGTDGYWSLIIDPQPPS